MISRDLIIEMSNAIIVVNKVTLKGIIDKAFLETRFFSKPNPFRMPLTSVLCKSCGKGIGLMNVGQRRIFKVILCHWETP